MKVRRFLPFLLLAAVILVAAAIFATSEKILADRFAELDAINVHNNISQVLNSLSYEISGLDQRAAALASIDRTDTFPGSIYSGAEGAGEGPPVSNQPGQGVDFAVFLDSSGNTLFSKSIDLNGQEWSAILHENSLYPQSPLLSPPEGGIAGVAILPEGPFILASRPVIYHSGEGNSPLGTVILGKRIDSDLTKRLAGNTGMPVTISGAGGPEIAPEITGALASSSQNPPFISLPAGRDVIAGYTLVKDIYGSPTVLIKASAPGLVQKNGRAVILYSVVSAAAAGAITGLLLLLFMERSVFSKLARVTEQIKETAEKGDFTRRLPVSGKGETARLTETINRLLEAFDRILHRLYWSEAKYRNLVERSPDLIYSINGRGEVVHVNRAGLKFLGYGSVDDVEGKHFSNFIHESDRDAVNKSLKKAVAKKLPSVREAHFRLVARNGEKIHVEANAALVYGQRENYTSIYGVIRDVTRRKQAEAELNIQKEYFQQLFENSPEGIAIIDNDGRFISVNRGFERLFLYPEKMLKGQRINDIIVPGDLAEEASALSEAVLKGEVVQVETIRKRRDGVDISVFILAYPIKLSDRQVGIYAIYNDITERKQAEEKLKYLSLHDPLTGLYNRAFFEQEMKILGGRRHHSTGIILCDVDGLKLINDTLGHDTGDSLLLSAAKIIKEAFRGSDTVARIGGDEFAILIPNSDINTIHRSCERIRDAIARYNALNPELPISISIGYATGNGDIKTMADLFKEADNNMYREKLHRSRNIRSSIVQTLTKAMEVRDFITEGHADRLRELVSNLGKALGLAERSISDLCLLAQFHDIGKVGIPDRIIFKPGPLTEEETVEMIRHSEIGHRIAQSTPDLAPIADWILKHHEWWNGNGYPLGLKGEQIPLECRILAIADAYDAMTSHRPYRETKSRDEALEELRKCSGSQFDPYIVSMFILALQLRDLKH
ncbi:MAG: PAS domain S-box protein [Bacillota bacterium]